MLGLTKKTNDHGDTYWEDANGKVYQTLQKYVESNLSESLIHLLVESKDVMENLAQSYFWKRYAADPEWQDLFQYRPHIKTIEINSDEVEIQAEAPACGRGCCGDDRHYFRFPTSYLWLDQSEVLADIKAKAEAEKMAEEARQAEEDARQKEAAEKREREQLASLKAKYEN